MSKNGVVGSPTLPLKKWKNVKLAFSQNNIEIISLAHFVNARKVIACWPLLVTSIGGCKYFMFLINDHSQMSWIYFL